MIKKEDIKFVKKPNHKRFKDIEGQEFGRLKVIGYTGRIKNNLYWWVECSCENKIIFKVKGTSLRYKSTKSCGCYVKDRLVELQLKPMNNLLLN